MNSKDGFFLSISDKLLDKILREKKFNILRKHAISATVNWREKLGKTG